MNTHTHTKNIIKKAEQFRFCYHGPEKLAELGLGKAELLGLFEATRNLSHPGSYGQTKYDDAFSLGYQLKHGVSASHLAFLQNNASDGWASNELACLTQLGLIHADALRCQYPSDFMLKPSAKIWTKGTLVENDLGDIQLGGVVTSYGALTGDTQNNTTQNHS